MAKNLMEILEESALELQKITPLKTESHWRIHGIGIYVYLHESHENQRFM